MDNTKKFKNTKSFLFSQITIIYQDDYNWISKKDRTRFYRSDFIKSSKLVRNAKMSLLRVSAGSK